MSTELQEAIATHDEIVRRIKELRAKGATFSADLQQSAEECSSTRAALDHGLGLETLGEIEPKKLKALHTAHEAASMRMRGLTSGASIVLQRIEETRRDLEEADTRLRNVAATDAAVLLPKHMERVSTLAADLAETLALCFELEAISRGSSELASGENAVFVGGEAYEALLKCGLGAGRGLMGSSFLGPPPGAKAKLTVRELLEMSELVTAQKTL